MKNTLCVLLLVCWSSLQCQTKQQTGDIEMLGEKLKRGDLSVNQVLSDPQWMSLHSQTSFRKIIEKNARAEKLVIVTPDEPGLKTTILGTITSPDGKPYANALVYMYQTSDKGWYADTAAHVLSKGSDIGHARLFGYVRTNHSGAFEMETIRPRGCPRSDLPAHIHILAWTSEGDELNGLPGELLFEEDDRLTPARKLEALNSGFLVSSNTGTAEKAVYRYNLVVRE